MKKTSLALALSLLAFSGMALAATPSPTSEIRESTDPGKAAEIERHASELQAQQQNGTANSATGSSDTSGSSASGTSHGRKHPHKGTKHHRGSTGSKTSGDSANSGGSSGSSIGAPDAPAPGASGDTASPGK
jgi:hypothetical protein